MLIRREEECDREDVYNVNMSAFETPSEAILVDVLREQAHPAVSIVADDEGEIVGHIMFSPVTLAGNSSLKMMGLAPMAVVPTRQNQGVGSELVKAGLEQCRRKGFSAVVVLGHPAFYPRFGFITSTVFGIHSEYDVPEEVFMAMELEPGALSGKTGKVKYHAAFGNL